MAESSDLPVYEVRNADGARELAIWADGRIEGGPVGLTMNRIPAMVAAAKRDRLRDMFAGCAMQGIMTQIGMAFLNENWVPGNAAMREAVAFRSYAMADAMLAERAKPPAR